MTIYEEEIFREQNEGKYILKTNHDFLEWFKNSLDDGYKSTLNINEMQNLINKIANWYEIKYPEREMDINDGILDSRFKGIKSVKDKLGFNQLLFRLNEKELNLIRSDYRSNSKVSIPLYDKDLLTSFNDILSIEVSSVNKDKYKEENIPSINILAKPEDGKVLKSADIKNYIGDNAVILDELLEIFDKKYKDELDYSKLKETVYNHKTDIELRHRLLQLVALKLIYSENTTPERGYNRAIKFINEFNESLGLRLDSKEIDEIMTKDYEHGIKWNYINRRKTDEFGEEFTFTTVIKVNDGENMLSPGRKSELERYLKSETEIEEFNIKDFDYLKLANKIPFDDFINTMIEYRKNSNAIDMDEDKIFNELQEKYECSSYELEKRIKDASEIINYRANNSKKLVKERREMIKRMNGSLI